jgi:hypothetical protein
VLVDGDVELQVIIGNPLAVGSNLVVTQISLCPDVQEVNMYNEDRSGRSRELSVNNYLLDHQ